MNKTVIFFGVGIFLIITWLVGFIKQLNEDVDVSYGFNEKVIVTGDMKNYRLDSSGNEILELDKLSLQEKKKLWNNSTLKEEMILVFPNFEEIKYFIKNRIEDDGSFQHLLLTHVEDVENNYIAGEMTGNRAKSMLSNL